MMKTCVFWLQNACSQKVTKYWKPANGDEAEKMILAEQPDIVLLDWMLPGKQGSEVCANIREKGFDKLIIMMTAKGTGCGQDRGL